jgi:hypothetical protein
MKKNNIDNQEKENFELKEKRPYPRLMYIQQLDLKDKTVIIGINKEDSKVYYWNSKIGDWSILRD